MKQEIGQQKTADVLVKKIFYITRKTKRKLISKFAAIWQKHFSYNAETVQFELPYPVEPRFNEMPREWQKWLVILRVRNIENFDTTNLRKNNQIVRYIDGWMTIFSIFLNHYNFFVVCCYATQHFCNSLQTLLCKDKVFVHNWTPVEGTTKMGEK